MVLCNGWETKFIGFYIFVVFNIILSYQEWIFLNHNGKYLEGKATMLSCKVDETEKIIKTT